MDTNRTSIDPYPFSGSNMNIPIGFSSDRRLDTVPSQQTQDKFLDKQVDLLAMHNQQVSLSELSGSDE